MKLLLINPKFDESFWSFEWAMTKLYSEVQYPVAPLGLASVAALTPEHWDVTIVDENVEPIDWDFPADVVGVGGMAVQFVRQHYILQRFRERGCFVVAGGSHCSLVPEHYEGVVDTVVAGEAEYIWPAFCRDVERGQAKPLYQETGDVDLADCPTPRFDLLRLERYATTAMQFSRGCPFRCEFCDIIVIFGRTPRTKRPAQIGAELDCLRRLGVKNVFFVDDNLIGHKPRCKELLAYLVEYQEQHRYRFHFGTEATINLAEDAKLLELFQAAHFGWVFIGIESPSQESLNETLKFQNTGIDLLESVRTLYRYGINIQAGFIVGFDSDDESIFERQFQFIQAAGISVPMVGLLIAIYHTPLWDRLEKAHRIREEALSPTAMLEGTPIDNTLPSTNFMPLNMSYRRLVEGYAELVRRLYDERAMYERICNKMAVMDDPIPNYYLPLSEQVLLTLRFLRYGILAGGPRRCTYFLRTLWLTRGRYARLNAVVDAWVNTLALKDFTDRNFDADRVAASATTPSAMDDLPARSPAG